MPNLQFVFSSSTEIGVCKLIEISFDFICKFRFALSGVQTVTQRTPQLNIIGFRKAYTHMSLYSTNTQRISLSDGGSIEITLIVALKGMQA